MRYLAYRVVPLKRKSQKHIGKLAKKYHPDLNPGDEEAAKKMSEINAVIIR